MLAQYFDKFLSPIFGFDAASEGILKTDFSPVKLLNFVDFKYDQLENLQGLPNGIITPGVNPLFDLVVEKASALIPEDESGVKPLPLVPREGTCTQYSTWSITNADDLRANINDIECIFQAGAPVNRAPVGQMRGELLLVLNSEVPPAVANPLYMGDYSYETGCINEDLSEPIYATYNFSKLRILPGLSLGVSRNSAAPYPLNLGPGEYPYFPQTTAWAADPNTLVMDFTVDTRDICPADFHAQGVFSKLKDAFFDPFRSSFPPINAYIDVGNVVGVNPDTNNVILLNKAMAYNYTSNELETVLYYAIEVSDYRIAPTSCYSNVPENLSQAVAVSEIQTCVGTLQQLVPDFTWSRPIIPAPESLVYSIRNAINAVTYPFMDLTKDLFSTPRLPGLLASWIDSIIMESMGSNDASLVNAAAAFKAQLLKLAPGQ